MSRVELSRVGMSWCPKGTKIKRLPDIGNMLCRYLWPWKTRLSLSILELLEFLCLYVRFHLWVLRCRRYWIPFAVCTIWTKNKTRLCQKFFCLEALVYSGFLSCVKMIDTSGKRGFDWGFFYWVLNSFYPDLFLMSVTTISSLTLFKISWLKSTLSTILYAVFNIEFCPMCL